VYCPLCKSEYRDGFYSCSDCHIALVGTREQADAVKVCLLWEGIGQSQFNDIAAMLGDANVPHLARSSARAERRRSVWFHVPIISSVMHAKEAYDQTGWQIFVMEADLANAQMLLRHNAKS
jgi:hypothetical protein